jgi:hypothetical protein
LSLARQPGGMVLFCFGFQEACVEMAIRLL